MKDVLILLVLLNGQITKLSPQPYSADSDGNCNSTRDYQSDDHNLCCKKCQPGQRLTQPCTETTDSVCKQCEPNQYMESWNYAPNCLSCKKCKPNKGLQYAKHCTSTTKAKCSCLPGMYCIMGFSDQDCDECRKYKDCKIGYGVSVSGTASSDVKCERCTDGKFSDTISYTDRCQDHTNCHGRAVVRNGTATSDTMCEPAPQTSMTESKLLTTVLATSDSIPTYRLTNYTQSIRSSTSALLFTDPTKSPVPKTGHQIIVAIICGVFASIVFIIVLVVCYKQFRKKDAAIPKTKLDENRNCESGVKIDQGSFGKPHQTSFTITSPEQQCLMHKEEACSDHTQYTCNTETLTGTEDCSSHESNGPLQSPIALSNSYYALSEPMPLISNIEPAMPQPSIVTQSSSQPTSPQIISPVTTSPQVNVNITVHIGNGSCGTPPIIPTDLIQAGCKLPFGEEESFSIPQQEDGKQSLLSVQESESYSV
ncbi:tumor necrosis factor receptor superfamily member 1B [Mastacembelus armatus]|uniref:Tumor necrosis factor receptor superfamily, member 1B n=1 Tax=Mastacembelus armatus TaxID=205130 RepID=A0A3Q3MPQ0_9TELE|nr:tumor necrosis factor receptor superfamily member 1B-like [Mastacembelus armatus]